MDAVASALPMTPADEIAEGYLMDKDTETCRETLSAIVTAKATALSLPKNQGKNPNDLPGFGSLTVPYLVLRLASESGTWYSVLGLKNDAATGVDEIEKHYQVLYKMLLDDPETCIDAEAYNLVTGAWKVLSDPRKREAYDKEMALNNGKNLRRHADREPFNLDLHKVPVAGPSELRDPRTGLPQALLPDFLFLKSLPDLGVLVDDHHLDYDSGHHEPDRRTVSRLLARGRPLSGDDIRPLSGDLKSEIINALD